MTNVTLIRWAGMTLIFLIACLTGSCIAVRRHADDADVARAQAETAAVVARAHATETEAQAAVQKAHDDALRASAEANKAMWDHMPLPAAPQKP